MPETTYLDHAATTPLRSEVREVMDRTALRLRGNPSSLHRPGREASVILEEARERVARALGAARREVVFTRGGTEAANLAILGRVEAARRAGRPGRLLYSAVEHRAVLDVAEALGDRGHPVRALPVDRDGLLDPGTARQALSPDDVLISVQWVNNEVGTIQPIEELARAADAVGVPLHTDAVQAPHLVRVDFESSGASLLSVSGHKLGGPVGAGVLLVRDDVELHPVLFGGGQERGLRPGTVDVVGAVGIAEALERAVDERETLAARLLRLRNRLEEGLKAGLDGIVVHAAGAPRAPHIVSLGIEAVPRDELLAALDLEGLAAAAGSACSSGSPLPSHVVTAMLGEEGAGRAVLRLSLGRTTTEAEIDRALERVPAAVDRLRRLTGNRSP